MLNVKIQKLHPDSKIPQYAKHGDAGMDLTATSKWYDESGNVCYGTSLAFEIPDGYVGFLFPRSSNTKKDLVLGNSVGVIDSGYRGEVVFKFKPSIEFITHEFAVNQKCGNMPHIHNEYEIGDRIGQIIIIPYPKINFIEVDELDKTERGNNGFGSTGK